MLIPPPGSVGHYFVSSVIRRQAAAGLLAEKQAPQSAMLREVARPKGKASGCNFLSFSLHFSSLFWNFGLARNLSSADMSPSPHFLAVALSS